MFVLKLLSHYICEHEWVTVVPKWDSLNSSTTTTTTTATVTLTRTSCAKYFQQDLQKNKSEMGEVRAERREERYVLLSRHRRDTSNEQNTH